MWWTAITLFLAANPHLEEGRKLYEQLKYPEAEARLKVAAQTPGSSPEEQAQIADLLARALIAQGRAGDAERTWAELLEKQPHAPDPAGASPKIRDVFNRAKKSVYPVDFVKLERRPAAPGRYEADLIDPWNKVAEVKLNGAAQPDARHFAGALPKGVTRLVALGVDGRELTVLEWTLTEVQQQPVMIAAPEEPKGPTRWPAFLTGAFAVAGLGAGGVFTAMAMNDYGFVKPETDAATTAAYDRRARDRAAIAYGAFGAGLALAVLTAVLVWNW